jgi:hypothetical protein
MPSMTYQQALDLCEEIRQENRKKWFTFNGMWCWGCSTFTKGDPTKRCFASQPDHCGCAQVNRRYDRRQSA